MISCGVLLVGYGGMEEGENKSSILGLSIVFVGTLITSAILIIEEFILKKYRTHPL